ncbi:MBL fold metallo-hydrolase RNA specificity domain-containing protein [Pseudidiomarina homiensis]|uniref:MBL fold hydrolase n=1 Tax=Pseudidiomarina homiensis TaxID=364198 RepID=A0A432Y5J7_9GAMM|nr:MBL fold metallo-hydrolase [Pseudidiomarina homiensis]RUO56217.1 MBL fold hydrolase [Pseudidiomarina homiensis]
MPAARSVIHHGAFQGVTGSCHQLFLTAEDSVLIDCGLFQGVESSAGSQGSALAPAIDFPLDSVRALVVTHTHIDHVGRIPYLLMAGFRGPIYCTRATALLLPLVIEDALRLGLTRDATLIASVLELLRSLLIPVEYDTWLALEVGAAVEVHLRFRQAGHILGSAYVEFEWINGVDAGFRIVFSGDIGCRGTPLLPDPEPLERADILYLESTYGDRLHESRHDREERLRKVIERCVADGGAVLIPAFSIGRTQELLYEIEDIIATHGSFWPAITVILDSPMAAAFTNLYQELNSLWDAEALARNASGRNPLDFARLHVVESHAEHERVVNYLRSTGDPCIVIAASGMCAGGRMQNYLQALLPDPRTDVVFVGYQAEGTPGREIQEYGPQGGYVVLDGERISIRAGVHTLGGYSAHADQRELLDFVLTASHVGRVRLIHGSPSAQQALTALLRQHHITSP